MGKATKLISGASQKKYFRDLLSATEGLAPAAAEKLGSTLEREVSAIRVRLPLPERGVKGEERRKVKPKATGAKPSEAAPSTSGAFDPYAFSVVVVVTKEGRDGLMQKLAAIESEDDLRALAKAQHVGLPAGTGSLDDLRQAIAEGALQRIANRRAAAS